jgi:hypothetical protein
MSLIVTDQLQESRVQLASSQQKSRVEVLTSAQVQGIKGRLKWNLQAARSTINIALLNNQSNS